MKKQNFPQSAEKSSQSLNENGNDSMSLSHFLRQLQISFLAAEHNCLMYQESGNNLCKMSAAPRGSSEIPLAANQVKFPFDTRHEHSFSMHFPNPNPLSNPHEVRNQLEREAAAA